MAGGSGCDVRARPREETNPAGVCGLSRAHLQDDRAGAVGLSETWPILSSFRWPSSPNPKQPSVSGRRFASRSEVDLAANGRAHLLVTLAVKTHTSAKCRKNNSPTRYRAESA